MGADAHPRLKQVMSIIASPSDNPRPSGATPNTILGPFYVSGAPRYDNEANI
jgi:catechol 1,2-dioxygenase